MRGCPHDHTTHHSRARRAQARAKASFICPGPGESVCRTAEYTHEEEAEASVCTLPSGMPAPLPNRWMGLGAWLHSTHFFLHMTQRRAACSSPASTGVIVAGTKRKHLDFQRGSCLNPCPPFFSFPCICMRGALETASQIWSAAESQTYFLFMGGVLFLFWFPAFLFSLGFFSSFDSPVQP